MSVLLQILLLIFSARLFAASPVIDSSQSKKNSAFELVIDPGHGGLDRGTIQGRLSESEIVLAMSLELQSLLKAQPDLTLHLTRDNDRGRNLVERVELAQKVNANLFVSIHANSNPSPRAQGAEFYIRESENRELFVETKSENTENASDLENILADLRAQGQLQQSLLFSKKLKKEWMQNSASIGSPDTTSPTATPPPSPRISDSPVVDKKSSAQKSPNRPLLKAAIRRAPFYVVSKTPMPSVLIEVGFMSNPQELRQLNSPEYRKVLAQKIYKAILSYKESVDKQKAPSLN